MRAYSVTQVHQGTVLDGFMNEFPDGYTFGDGYVYDGVGRTTRIIR